MELALGKLPNGTQLVSRENLLARRQKQVAIGETYGYGMGLFVDSLWDVAVIRHGGGMPGYRSQMWMLPEYGVGAVILTNADAGDLLFEPFVRRLLEVLFDGKPEAKENLLASSRSWRERITKQRERLVVPCDPMESGQTRRALSQPRLGRLGSTQVRCPPGL
jgi:CubicO group peptidase (beta-lactamase class C family)